MKANRERKAGVSPEIADAIAAHRLIEGMSFQQARQSARLPFQVVSAKGSTKTYRWLIKGRLKTNHIEISQSLHGTVVRRVPDFGVVAYVEATFVDDKLTTYARHRAR
jgi:hypothetical protein